jgi:hypothetical protein
MAGDRENLGRGESPQVDARKIMILLASLFGSLVVIAFGLMLIFPDRIGMTFVDSHPFPAPSVAPDEGRERRQLEMEQKVVLAGVRGHQPIEAAMAAIIARGAHAFDPIGTRP